MNFFEPNRRYCREAKVRADLEEAASAARAHLRPDAGGIRGCRWRPIGGRRRGGRKQHGWGQPPGLDRRHPRGHGPLCAGVQASRRAGEQRQQMEMVFRRPESSEGFCGLALWCRRLCPERPGEEEYSDIFLQVRCLRPTKPISQGEAGLCQGSNRPRVSVPAPG